MLFKSLLAAASVFVAAASVAAQAPEAGQKAPSATWRTAGTEPIRPVSALTGDATATPGPTATPASGRIARVTKGNGTLPNGAGQTWLEYDISPYTLRVTETARPEQAIVDWILRETGYEAWHGEPLGILSATRRTLRVYHTPQVQAVVADIVDRFVSTEAETRAFGIRVLTLDHPNWRARARKILRPVQVQTPGVQAWILSKEDAALAAAELRKRNDYREHNSPHLLVSNGQSTVIPAMRARSYVRDVMLRPGTWPGFEPEVAQIDEGFSLEFSPLLSADGQMIDATIKCTIIQVEKMIPVMLEVPTPAAPRQRTKIEVPQISHFRFHERFRWPENHVLVIGMGMVAVPGPPGGKTLVPGIPLKLPSGPARGELLVIVESRGKIAPNPATTRRAGAPAGLVPRR